MHATNTKPSPRCVAGPVHAVLVVRYYVLVVAQTVQCMNIGWYCHGGLQFTKQHAKLLSVDVARTII